jgi:hypothetical protein
MLYVIPAVLAVLLLASAIVAVCLVVQLQARIDRLERMRRLAGDPFGEPFGEIAPLPAGSIIELHEHTHSARPASRADQGSGGDGTTSQGAAAARPYRGRARRAF